jgi:alkanesulfonate monooxygenase
VISGSSAAGLAVARELGATAVKYPQPSANEAPQHDEEVDVGMRIGIIAREDAEEAWRLAYERFPEDRAGQIAHGLAMRVSDSEWHRQLSELAHERAAQNDCYWLGPFMNYKTFCPYLVGDHETVAAELGRYVELGFRTFILDIPASEEELAHAREVFQVAEASRRP